MSFAVGTDTVCNQTSAVVAAFDNQCSFRCNNVSEINPVWKTNMFCIREIECDRNTVSFFYRFRLQYSINCNSGLYVSIVFSPAAIGDNNGRCFVLFLRRKIRYNIDNYIFIRVKIPSDLVAKLYINNTDC